MVPLLMKWLHAGVMEGGELHEVREGAPQGGGISPLLSNIYLHFVLNLWVSQWRMRHARGEAYFVRFADDIVMAFQYEQDARAMREALADRLAKFGLELHPEKTRVLRFGRFALGDEQRRGLRPQTFDFLGPNAYCGQNPHRRVLAATSHLGEEARSEAGNRCERKCGYACTSHRKSSMRGYAACFVATISITECPRIIGRWRPFAIRSSRPGTVGFNDGVNAQAGHRRRANASRRISRFQPLASSILGLRHASLARRPEVGALCGNPALRDLSGGRLERGVPTGTFTDPRVREVTVPLHPKRRLRDGRRERGSQDGEQCEPGLDRSADAGNAQHRLSRFGGS